MRTSSVSSRPQVKEKPGLGVTISLDAEASDMFELLMQKELIGRSKRAFAKKVLTEAIFARVKKAQESGEW